VAMIAPRIRGIYPANQVSPHNLAMVPETIAAGPRYTPRQARTMLARNSRPAPQARTAVAALPTPPSRPAPVVAVAAAPPAFSGGAPSSRFSLIPSAHAATMPRPPAGGASRWAVQVGAFASESLARSTANDARGKARELAGGLAFVMPTEATRNRLYRARVGGLSRDAATDGCQKLRALRWQCTIISPEAQS